MSTKSLVGPRAQLEIGLDDVLDHVDDLRIGQRRARSGADAGVLVGAAAEGDLVELLALLVDAENADMADMVMAAGIDAAGNLDLQLADVVLARLDRRKRSVICCAIGIERALASAQ